MLSNLNKLHVAHNLAKDRVNFDSLVTLKFDYQIEFYFIAVNACCHEVVSVRSILVANLTFSLALAT